MEHQHAGGRQDVLARPGAHHIAGHRRECEPRGYTTASPNRSARGEPDKRFIRREPLTAWQRLLGPGSERIGDPAQCAISGSSGTAWVALAASSPAPVAATHSLRSHRIDRIGCYCNRRIWVHLAGRSIQSVLSQVLRTKGYRSATVRTTETGRIEGSIATVSGWCPQNRLEHRKERLRASLTIRCSLDTVPTLFYHAGGSY